MCVCSGPTVCHPLAARAWVPRAAAPGPVRRRGQAGALCPGQVHPAVTVCVERLRDTYCRALLIVKRDLEPGLDGSRGDRGEDDGHFDGAEGADVTLRDLQGGQRPPVRLHPGKSLPPPSLQPPRCEVPGRPLGHTDTGPKPGPALRGLPARTPAQGGAKGSPQPPIPPMLPLPCVQGWPRRHPALARTMPCTQEPQEPAHCCSGPGRPRLGTGVAGRRPRLQAAPRLCFQWPISLVWLWSKQTGANGPAGCGWGAGGPH